MADRGDSEVKQYVSDNIIKFHEAKLESLKKLTLQNVLKKKNPYLFRAKNINLASGLVEDILNAYLSSSEEKLFGDFLEGLAIFISGKACGGVKSAATGVDLEFDKDGVRYIVSIKSGPNWGNSSQQRRLEQDLQNGMRVLKQSNHQLNVQPTLGICYGKTRTSYIRGYLKVTGQNFWYLISNNKNLYLDIIEPLGHKAKQHNDSFLKKKDAIINRFTKELLDLYSDDSVINWKKIIEYNSGNLDIE